MSLGSFLSVLVGALCCCAVVAPAHAGDRIDTDGPDFVESTESVAQGHWQFETGPQQTTDRRPGSHVNTSTTPLLLKAGVGDGMELRLETDGYSHVAGSDAPAGLRGMADTAIGIKWHVQDSQAGTPTPALAWIVHVELPSGSPALRGIGLRPSLRAVIGWDLPHDFTLGVMPGVKADTREDGHRFVSGILGVVAGYWWTPRLRSFIEAEADSIARQQDGGVILYKNVGAAYVIADDWQIGGRAGWAANSNTPSRYLMLSLAGRF